MDTSDVATQSRGSWSFVWRQRAAVYTGVICTLSFTSLGKNDPWHVNVRPQNDGVTEKERAGGGRGRERERKREREREVERVAHGGKRISLYVWPGSVVYAKRSAHRVTMSAARSGWLRLIIRLHFCTSSTVTPPPFPLFSSRIKLRELGSRPIKFIRACFRGGEKNVAAIQRL